jgi:hypothetical protein
MITKAGHSGICVSTCAALFFFAVQSANSQSFDCSAVLSESILNRRIATTNNNYVAAEHYWACSASSEEIRRYVGKAENKNFLHDGNVGYGQVLGIKGNNRYSKATDIKDDDIRKWQNQNCSERDGKNNLSAAQYLSHEFLPPENIEAWKSCVLRDEFSCFAEPAKNDVNFVSNWNSRDTELPVIKEFYTYAANVQTPVRHEGRLFMDRHDHTIPGDSSKDLRVVLRAVHRDRFNKSCSVFIPAKVETAPIQVPAQPEFNLSSLLGTRWCNRPGNRSFTFIGKSGDALGSKVRVAEEFKPHDGEVQEYLLVKNDNGSLGLISSRLRYVHLTSAVPFSRGTISNTFGDKWTWFIGVTKGNTPNSIQVQLGDFQLPEDRAMPYGEAWTRISGERYELFYPCIN